MNARTFLNNLPIKRKLLLVTVVTCAAALALACTTLFWFQSVQFRKGFADELESLASIISHNSSATLTFDDKKSAVEVLSALKAKPHINLARIYDGDGKLFAQYGEEDMKHGATAPSMNSGVLFNNGHAGLTVPISIQDSKPGRLQLQAQYQGKYSELVRLYVSVLTAVVLCSLLLIILLSSLLQQIITTPIVTLAGVAKTITDQEDYSARAPSGGHDEVGQLTRAFNSMLDQIQARDAALNISQGKLEALIHSIDGTVWEWNPADETFGFVSRQCERMFGHPHESWLGDPVFWSKIVHPDDLERATQACDDAIAEKKPYSHEYRMIAADQRVVWIRESGVVRVENNRVTAFHGLFLDITEQKQAAEDLAKLNQQLMDTSRQAGMAEVATGVLHNVGNVLNSVNVSATLVCDHVRQSKAVNLRRATAMLLDKNGHLAEFLTSDPKGRLLPTYLATVADQITEEQKEVVAELTSLSHHIEHIKEIVAMQQSYAKVSGAFENLAADELVQDAMKMNLSAFERHSVEVVSEATPNLPLVCVDRHKVLQILINLIRNAKHAMDDSGVVNKRLHICVSAAGEKRVKISVTDNGIGIPSENLLKIFNHGFTTKKEGHGFGLHSGANAAKEMGGSLTAHSDGPGKGATFTLELPTAKNQA